MRTIRKTSITLTRTTAAETTGATSTPVTRITVMLATMAIILTIEIGTTTIISETTNVIMTTGDKTSITAIITVIMSPIETVFPSNTVLKSLTENCQM